MVNLTNRLQILSRLLQFVVNCIPKISCIQSVYSLTFYNRKWAFTPPKTTSNTSDMVFGAMLLFIYNLTRIFYEKLLSLCQNQGAEWQKREIAISHNCKAQLIPLFYPQACNYLIIKVVYFLHRKDVTKVIIQSLTKHNLPINSSFCLGVQTFCIDNLYFCVG